MFSDIYHNGLVFFAKRGLKVYDPTQFSTRFFRGNL